MDETATSAQYARMKHIYLQMAAGLAATFTIGASSACAQQQENETPPVQIEMADDGSWNDQPQTPGTWVYISEPGEAFAYFGDRAMPDNRHFMIRCDRPTRQVWLARSSEQVGDVLMRVRTETQDQLFTAEPVPMTGLIAVELAADNRLLDAMAITKGRFAVEVEGMEPLYLPAWAEVTRVIEDCR
ncbi:MAG: hypothetical protein O3C52_01020 [Proteobacteria bacterium]|nr:hypothetical protein [Pseudomonadota bacterium]MDA0915046.1 hypothetical protein [Pseudomonadota bacterium]MDA1031951.1 hypothetical protein [Pseudomonadota bacterium]